ncbi:MAG: type II toxin-antitoxin system HigB family toxin [Candidatus Poribacteria bacterium]|nr:type II toxin-antitoxin system HigB family toxin [Candidatus Poribacteria bacterium]
MHVISKKALREFWEKHPNSQTPLRRWFTLITKSSFGNFIELRAVFPSVDFVDNLAVFNIGGNKYRLIVSIHFNRGKVYVRHVLTHDEYNRGEWKT